MESHGGNKHPWKNDAFLFEQMDYIVDRLYAASAIYIVVEKSNTSHRAEKEERLLQLCSDCREANEGQEETERNFLGKFTRILKLLTDAYSEAIGGDASQPVESPGDNPTKSSSPRHSFMRSSSVSSPRSLRHSLKKSISSLDAADQINADFEKHHYARLLGLMLGEIYRLMDQDILPPIREVDKNTTCYRTAIRIQLPITPTAEYDSIGTWYSELKLRTQPPIPEGQTQSHGKTF